MPPSHMLATSSSQEFYIMKSNPLSCLTVRQYLDGLAKKQFSAKEVATDVWTNTIHCNGMYNIFTTLLPEPAQIKQTGALQGAPMALKDNILTKDIRTTASAKVLDSFIPPYNATIAQKLDSAGMTLVGKTNLDAWAHGSSTETSDYDRTLNPNNPEHLPGGSSGGSAAAVAANCCLAAIGTETAGSIRQPSAWCGTVGLKPTYGRVSRYGIVAMASSTDSPGPITKTVEDAAILLEIIAGKDPLDGTSTEESVPNYTHVLNKSIAGLRIGVLYQDLAGLELVNTQMKPVIDVFTSLGAKVSLAHAMDPHYAISVYTIVQRAEVSSNLARYDGIRYGKDRSFFGSEAKRRIMLGTYTLAKGYAEQYYLTAQKVRTLFIQDFERLFADYDVLIHPTSPGFAKKVGATEGEAMFGELEDMLLEPSSITGLPGINVPYHRDPKTNLTLGLNIMAPKFREDLVITVADAFEKNTEWNWWRNQDAS